MQEGDQAIAMILFLLAIASAARCTPCRRPRPAWSAAPLAAAEAASSSWIASDRRGRRDRDRVARGHALIAAYRRSAAARAAADAAHRSSAPANVSSTQADVERHHRRDAPHRDHEQRAEHRGAQRPASPLALHSAVAPSRIDDKYAKPYVHVTASTNARGAPTGNSERAPAAPPRDRPRPSAARAATRGRTRSSTTAVSTSAAVRDPETLSAVSHAACSSTARSANRPPRAAAATTRAAGRARNPTARRTSCGPTALEQAARDQPVAEAMVREVLDVLDRREADRRGAREHHAVDRLVELAAAHREHPRREQLQRPPRRRRRRSKHASSDSGSAPATTGRARSLRDPGTATGPTDAVR